MSDSIDRDIVGAVTEEDGVPTFIGLLPDGGAYVEKLRGYHNGTPVTQPFFRYVFMSNGIPLMLIDHCLN